MKPEQALEMIERIKKEAPNNLVAAANTVALEAPKWALHAQSRDKRILEMLLEQGKKMDELIARLGGAPATEGEAPGPQSHPPEGAAAPAGAPRTYADGTPMSPEAAAMEDAMDAATAGLPPNPDAPKPQPLPRMGNVPIDVPMPPPVASPVAAAPAAPPPVVHQVGKAKGANNSNDAKA